MVMSDPTTDPTLDRLLRHMAWANAALFARLTELPVEDLALASPRNEWSVAMILDHLVAAAGRYAARLEGAPRPDRATSPATTAGLAELAADCAAYDARIRAQAAQARRADRLRRPQHRRPGAIDRRRAGDPSRDRASGPDRGGAGHERRRRDRPRRAGPLVVRRSGGPGRVGGGRPHPAPDRARPDDFRPRAAGRRAGRARRAPRPGRQDRGRAVRRGDHARVRRSACWSPSVSCRRSAGRPSWTSPAGPTRADRRSRACGPPSSSPGCAGCCSPSGRTRSGSTSAIWTARPSSTIASTWASPVPWTSCRPRRSMPSTRADSLARPNSGPPTGPPPTRVRSEIHRQERRLLRPGGILIHSDGRRPRRSRRWPRL